MTDARPTSRGRMRVLVVDDSFDHRTLISRRLESSGMHVDTAGSAAECLERLEDVDLVLLDYRLPGVDGLELLDAIRSRRDPPSVIMVTGAGSTQVAVDAMRSGAINYVAKDHGYIETLPEVVERAWHHHDLATRATQLQRLALMVTSATDRDQLSQEIVDGATRLLRTRSCVLLVEVEGRLAPAGGRGPEQEELRTLPDRVELQAEVRSVVEGERGAGTGAHLVGPYLLVPLPSESGEAVGLLVATGTDAGFSDQELELSEVFASFAGIALGKLRQFELERLLATELQQTLDARRDFVASISHELRTPLTSIAGFTETLRTHWEQLEDDKRTSLLGRIHRNAEDLGALVDELLDLARLERGQAAQLRIEPLTVDGQVARVLDQLEGLLEEREVRVDVPALEVLADAALLRRALANLVSNAVKFSEVGSPIEVRARADDEGVRIEVVDHGIGLPAWELSRVFDPFFRARSSVANAVRGSGIGLALVREYVRSMGGEVAAASVPGEGSTFGLLLPAAGRVITLPDEVGRD